MSHVSEKTCTAFLCHLTGRRAQSVISIANSRALSGTTHVRSVKEQVRCLLQTCLAQEAGEVTPSKLQFKGAAAKGLRDVTHGIMSEGFPGKVDKSLCIPELMSVPKLTNTARVKEKALKAWLETQINGKDAGGFLDASLPSLYFIREDCGFVLKSHES